MMQVRAVATSDGERETLASEAPPVGLVSWRCAHCGALLGRFAPDTAGEVKCRRCKRLNRRALDDNRPVAYPDA